MKSGVFYHRSTEKCEMRRGGRVRDIVRRGMGMGLETRGPLLQRVFIHLPSTLGLSKQTPPSQVPLFTA